MGSSPRSRDGGIKFGILYEVPVLLFFIPSSLHLAYDERQQSTKSKYELVSLAFLLLMVLNESSRIK